MTHALSEKACATLITKLQLLQLVPELIPTLDRTGFLTASKLDLEILEIVQNQKRINLHDLPSLLNIELACIEKRIKELALPNRWRLIRGDLITSEYFDGLISALNAQLLESGFVFVRDICLVHHLPVDIVLSILEERGNEIDGQLEEKEVVCTNEYLARRMDTLRETVGALKKPTLLASMHLDPPVPTRSLQQMVESLLKKGEIQGALKRRKDGILYTPSFYIESQMATIGEMLAQNGYVDKANLSLQGADMKFLQEHFPEVVLVGECGVSAKFLTQVEGLIEAEMESGSYIDLLSVVPPVIPESEIPALLSHIPSLARHGEVLGTFVVSQSMLRDCVQRLRPFLERTVIHSKSGRRSKEKAVVEEDGIELRESDVARELQVALGDSVEAKVCSLIAKRIMGQLRKEYSALSQSVFISSTVPSEEKEANEQNKQSEMNDVINRAYHTFLLCTRALSLFDNTTRTNLEKHLLRTRASELTDIVSAQQKRWHGAEGTKGTDTLPRLPHACRDRILKLADVASNGKMAADFLSYFEEACSHFEGVQLRPLDDGIEHAILSDYHASLHSQLRNSTSPALTLHLTLLLLCQTALPHHGIVHASGKFVPKLVQRIQQEKGLREEDIAACAQLQAMILESVRSGVERIDELLVKRVKEIGLNLTHSK
ncbi:uncharacterized protein VTP21DRAFT_29 [Calcarisporiella thermophila]|uniref:uncharacterized protein n=1 Tax=Calcarisporiella thermophila TaxID=911321 RepID=UPI0037444B6A